MIDNLAIWNSVRRPPVGALKNVAVGTRKFTDINPVWRLEIITSQFGPCGIGWRYEVTERWTDPGVGGEVMCFVAVAVKIAIVSDDGSKIWSELIPGIGGSVLIAKNSTGLKASDEGWKMALTDALSVAFKALGVAADIYRGFFVDSKYSAESQPYVAPVSQIDIASAKRALSEAVASGGEAGLRAAYANLDPTLRLQVKEFAKGIKPVAIEVAA
jgi:hypothetical protein